MFTKKPVKITTGFSLKRISLLIALVLLSPAALPADRPANSTVVPKGVSTEPLNINYTRTDSGSGGFDTFGADFCHTRADELKIRVIPAPGMTVGTDARMTLTITGSGYIKNYAVFKNKLAVSPAKTDTAPPGVSFTAAEQAAYYPAAKAAKEVYITHDFVKPWNIGYAEDVHGRWDYTYTVPIKKWGDVYSDRFCFVKFNQIKTQYFIFGYEPDHAVFFDFHYFPIFENKDFARKVGLPTELTGGTPWGQVLALGIANTYLDQYAFDISCRGRKEGVDTWDLNHYWPEKDWGGGASVTMPGPVKAKVTEQGKSYLLTNMFYMKKTRGELPSSGTETKTVQHPFDYNGAGKPATYSQNSIRFSILPAPHGISANYFLITSGSGYELTVNNRNISKIELTITDSSGTQTLSWGEEKGTNNLTYKSTDGAKIFKSAPAVDQKNDPYAGFYQNDRDYFRGTLALMNGEYTKYVNEKMPLSLNPQTPGKLNLVNMEELIFRLGGAPGAYTLSVEGQPLKFADLYINGQKKAVAMRLRNACK